MLEHHWYIACTSKAVTKKPYSFEAFNRSLVAFRTNQGEVAVLEDRCAHRNAPLSAGFVDGDLLRCPYHGWGYQADGVVGDIPACPASSDANKTVCINSYSALEQDGYIWFCLGDKTAVDKPNAFEHVNDSDWTTFRMDTLFNAPVESCLENFLDCPHATYVHKFWFRKPTAKLVKVEVSTTPDGAMATYFDEPREGSVVWNLLSKRQSSLVHTDRFIAPSTTKVDYIFSDTRHYIITSSCTPVTDTKTRVHTVMTYRFGKIGWLIRLFFEPLSRWIIQQDVRMVALQQKNITRFGSKRYNIIEQDLLYKHIVQWRRAFEKQSTVVPDSETKSIDLKL